MYIARRVVARLARLGVDSTLAREAARMVAGDVQARWGGDNVYVPRAPRRQHERDDAIRRAFNGRNYRELAGRYRLTRSRIYQIVASRPR